jgi:acetolactate synthase-1/2/3 large subunit
MDKAADALNGASMPLILCGGMASSAEAVVALRALLASHPIPVISTFQGTGTVSKEMADLYCGRVGLTKNQPADKLLDDADVILAIGYDVIEYDASIWNTSGKKKTIIHLDHTPFDVDNDFSPEIELIGSISETLQELTMRLALNKSLKPEEITHLKEIKKQRENFFTLLNSTNHVKGLVHPLQIVSTLQALLERYEDLTYFSDMGSFHIWLSRYLVVHKPRQLVNTNGQQTLGVALPWAMSAAFDAKKKGTDKTEKIISISGDGGFLFSAFELETASRFNLNLVHIIFDDCCYNMVKVQQEKKYGASEAVELGSVDFVKLAESLGASGFKVTDAEALPSIVDKALAMDGPVVIQVMVDYSDNHKLFEDAHEHAFH